MRDVGAEPISRLARALRPRYHFASLHNRFYERTPYRWVGLNSVCPSVYLLPTLNFPFTRFGLCPP